MFKKIRSLWRRDVELFIRFLVRTAQQLMLESPRELLRPDLQNIADPAAHHLQLVNTTEKPNIKLTGRMSRFSTQTLIGSNVASERQFRSAETKAPSTEIGADMIFHLSMTVCCCMAVHSHVTQEGDNNIHTSHSTDEGLVCNRPKALVSII